MTRSEFDAIAATFPGAVLSGPGELDAWKIGGKMFACFGHVDNRPRNDDHAVVRCADTETAQMLIDAGAGGKPAYFRGAWIRIDLPSLDPDEARHRLAVSYETVRAGLPRRIRDTLPHAAPASAPEPRRAGSAPSHSAAPRRKG